MDWMRKSIVVAMFAALPLAAGATTKVYTFNLDGSQEVPASGSSAVGSGEVTVDDVADTISFSVVALGLQGTFAASHIHQGAAGTNGGVVFDLGANADAQGPLTIGTFVIPNSYALYGTDKASSFADAINATPWDFYVNIHTSAFGGGELRGQLAAAPIPEPATMLLLAVGLGVVGSAARARRARG